MKTLELTHECHIQREEVRFAAQIGEPRLDNRLHFTNI